MKEDKTCKICGKIFTRRNYMQKHMEHIHSKRYSCPKCFRFFSGPTEHSCAIDNGRFHCYVRDCSLRFSNGMAMRLHIRDCHRKLDETGIGEVIKTKKGVRELIQTLCKKINLLSSCFDELKYQVDTIGVFLKSKNADFNYEIPVKTKHSASNQEKKKNESSILVRETKSVDYEDVDYIDEEFEELTEEFENTDEFPNENPIILDETVEYIPVATMDLKDKNSLMVSSNKKNQSYPKRSESKTFPSSASTSQSSPQIIIKDPIHIVPIPKMTTIGSTIITQIPAHLVHHPKRIDQSKVVKETPAVTMIGALNTPGTKRKATSTVTKSANIDSTTPPLFLKIEYDTETTVCETDPKITFHFDTKPPDLVQEDIL